MKYVILSLLLFSLIGCATEYPKQVRLKTKDYIIFEKKDSVICAEQIGGKTIVSSKEKCNTDS